VQRLTSLDMAVVGCGLRNTEQWRDLAQRQVRAPVRGYQ
jgi:hypothetical protein